MEEHKNGGGDLDFDAIGGFRSTEVFDERGGVLDFDEYEGEE